MATTIKTPPVVRPAPVRMRAAPAAAPSARPGAGALTPIVTAGAVAKPLAKGDIVWPKVAPHPGEEGKIVEIVGGDAFIDWGVKAAARPARMPLDLLVRAAG